MNERDECRERRLVDAHFEGSIRPEDERRLRRHLPECAACRARYERHLALAALDPKAAPASERLARGLGLRRPSRPWLVAAPLFAAAAAALLVLAVRGNFERGAETTETVDGFLSRGGAEGTPAGEIRVWRVTDAAEGAVGAVPLEDGGVMAPDDELAFAYENPAGRSRLLVFGVDAAGRVYWYHPAWESASPASPGFENGFENAGAPRAILIEAGPGPRELPAAIRHDLPEGRLWLHAVFTDVPLDVRAVERLQADLGRPDAPLPLDGATQRTITVTVRRAAEGS